MFFFKNVLRKGKSFFNQTRERGRRFYNNLIRKSPLLLKNTVKLEQLSSWEKTLIKIIDQTYQVSRDNNIDNMKLDYQDSSTVAYVDSDNLIIGYRGTDNLQDVITDIEFAKHKEGQSERFLRDLGKYDNIVENYPNRYITVVGHSLGSAIALFINSKRKNVDAVYCINPAFNLRNILNSYSRRHKHNVTILRTPNDPVSLLSALSGYDIKTVEGMDDIIESHKLHNFIK